MQSSSGPDAMARSPTKRRLLLELGRGGMGTVYLAATSGPGGFQKLSVVKRLTPDLACDPDFLKMFLDEARLAARLNHPNIVQTLEVGADERGHFIEMEYMEGQSLQTLVRGAAKSHALTTPLAIWILAQTLAGLHHAHELTAYDGTALHVVHRDVSPHNVFVTYDGAVKLLDFGIAKAADSSSRTATGVFKGKLHYMAPEQVLLRPVDRRADVFAVGVILWQLLTGERLWGGLADHEVVEKLADGCIPSPRSLAPEVPEDLDAICMRALAATPDERYATAADFEAALEDHLERSGARPTPRQLGKVLCAFFRLERFK